MHYAAYTNTHTHTHIFNTCLLKIFSELHLCDKPKSHVGGAYDFSGPNDYVVDFHDVLADSV